MACHAPSPVFPLPAKSITRSSLWLGSLGLALTTALTTGLTLPAIAQDSESGAAALQSAPAAPPAPAPAAPAPPPTFTPKRQVIAPPRAVPNPAPRRSAPRPAPQAVPQKRSPTPVSIPTAPVVRPPSIPSATGSGFIDRSKGYDLGATQPVGEVQFSTRQAGQSGPARSNPIRCQTTACLQQTTAAPGRISGNRNVNPRGIPTGGSPNANLGRLSRGSVPLPNAPAAIRIGPLSVSAKGIGIGSNYFFRTERPKGIAGNNDQGFVYPLSVPSVISSAFGWRTHPILGYRRFHAGTDFAAPMGTPVTAMLSGRVTWSNFMGGYGLAVALEHKNGTQKTLYAHLSEIFVKPGEQVKQGDVIGRVGSTGLSTGPHLHLEVREFRNGSWMALDPGKFLASVGAPIPVTEADKNKDPFELMMTRLIAAMEASHRGQYDGEDLAKLKEAEKAAKAEAEAQAAADKEKSLEKALPVVGQDDRINFDPPTDRPVRRPRITP